VFAFKLIGYSHFFSISIPPRGAFARPENFKTLHSNFDIAETFKE